MARPHHIVCGVDRDCTAADCLARVFGAAGIRVQEPRHLDDVTGSGPLVVKAGAGVRGLPDFDAVDGVAVFGEPRAHKHVERMGSWRSGGPSSAVRPLQPSICAGQNGRRARGEETCHRWRPSGSIPTPTRWVSSTCTQCRPQPVPCFEAGMGEFGLVWAVGWAASPVAVSLATLERGDPRIARAVWRVLSVEERHDTSRIRRAIVLAQEGIFQRGVDKPAFLGVDPTIVILIVFGRHIGAGPESRHFFTMFVVCGNIPHAYGVRDCGVTPCLGAHVCCTPRHSAKYAKTVTV